MDNMDDITLSSDLDVQLARINDPYYLHAKSMQELYDTGFAYKEPIIDELLYAGTYLFVGAPKLGKSLCMLQLAYSVSTGTSLWGYNVHQGAVLYLALEDDYCRLQTRLYRMFGADGTDNLYLSIAAKQLGAGLEDQLQGFLVEHPETKLVIVDTLQKIRENAGPMYSYASDYDIISKLKEMAEKLEICLILVHHTRKQGDSDSFNLISGTNGLLGAADGAFVLLKNARTDNGATIEIVGRDQQDQKLYITRDLGTLCWELDRAEVESWVELPNPVLEAVAQLVTRDAPLWSGTATALVDELGLDMHPNTLSTHLNVNSGRLLKEYGIRYERTRSRTSRSISHTLVAPP